MMKSSYHRWSQEPQKSLRSFIQIRILPQPLVINTRGWRCYSISSNAVSPRTKSHEYIKSESKTPYSQAQQPQQFPNMLLSVSAESDALWVTSAAYLDTHGFSMDLCSSFTWALLEIPALPRIWSSTSCKAWTCYVDLPPAAGSFPE